MKFYEEIIVCEVRTNMINPPFLVKKESGSLTIFLVLQISGEFNEPGG